jgi:Outer membrane protein beta-barrel domain
MKYLKISLITLLIITPFITNAQFKFGAGGGVNFANLSGSDVSGVKGLTGFNAGVMMEVKLPIKIGIEADILYSLKGAKSSASDIDIKLSYIDIPVVLKIYTLKVLSIQIGPQYSFLATAKSDGEDIKDGFKPGDLSAVVGIGVDVLKLHVSARYNYGLTSIDKGSADVKNNMLTLSVGFWFK